MLQQAQILFNSSMIAGSNISLAVQWPGGRSAVVVTATAYAASALQLQTQGPTSATRVTVGSTVTTTISGGGWINVASSFISDQVFPFDAVPGNYRLVNQSTSSVIGINAVLVTIPYF